MNTNTAAACHRNTHYKVEKLVTEAGNAGPFQRSQYVFVYGQRRGVQDTSSQYLGKDQSRG